MQPLKEVILIRAWPVIFAAGKRQPIEGLHPAPAGTWACPNSSLRALWALEDHGGAE